MPCRPRLARWLDIGEKAPVLLLTFRGSVVEAEVVLVLLDLPSRGAAAGPKGELKGAGAVPMVEPPCSGLEGLEPGPVGSFLREGPDRGWKPEPSGAKAGCVGVPPSIS